MFKTALMAASVLAGIACAAAPANATTYYLKDVKFDDGTTLSGTIRTNQYGYAEYRNVTSQTGSIAGFHYDSHANLAYDPGDTAFTFYYPAYDGQLILETGHSLDVLVGQIALMTGGASHECSNSACSAGNMRNVLSGFVTTDAPSVPEPASWALMLAGIGAVGASLRRRRRLTNVMA